MFSSGSGSGNLMDSIPENITFNSPHAKHRRVDEDDNSSIESAPTHARGKAFRSASGQKTTGLMEEEDDDDDDEEDSWGENLMDVDSYASEVENLRQQVKSSRALFMASTRRVPKTVVTPCPLVLLLLLPRRPRPITDLQPLLLTARLPVAVLLLGAVAVNTSAQDKLNKTMTKDPTRKPGRLRDCNR